MNNTGLHGITYRGNYVTKKKGYKGVVRKIICLIIKNNIKYNEAFNKEQLCVHEIVVILHITVLQIA